MTFVIEQHNGLPGDAAAWRRATDYTYATRGEAITHAEQLLSTPEQPLRVRRLPQGLTDRQIDERDDVPDSLESLGLIEGRYGEWR